MTFCSYLFIFILGIICGKISKRIIKKLLNNKDIKRVYCKQVVEALSGALYLLGYIHFGIKGELIIYCLLINILLIISVIDIYSYEIPFFLNVLVFCLGLLNIFSNKENIFGYIIGFFSVSLWLYIIYILSNGKAIGGGDIYLTAASGLLLGYKLNIVAFMLCCILGSIIHITRMKIFKSNNVLALGPYISMGIVISILYGTKLLDWYFGLLF